MEMIEPYEKEEIGLPICLNTRLWALLAQYGGRGFFLVSKIPFGRFEMVDGMVTDTIRFGQVASRKPDDLATHDKASRTTARDLLSQRHVYSKRSKQDRHMK